MQVFNEDLRVGNYVIDLDGSIHKLASGTDIDGAWKAIELTEEMLPKLGFKTKTEIGEGKFNYWSIEHDASIDVEYELTSNAVETFFRYRCLGSKEHRVMIIHLHTLQNLHKALKKEELTLTGA